MTDRGSNAQTRNERQRVLFVSFDFPPQRTSGAYRYVGLLRHLPALGWDPVVVSAQETVGDAVEDQALTERLPNGIQVERTPFLRLHGWEAAASSSLKKAGLQRETQSLWKRTLYRMARSTAQFVQSCLYFPDTSVGWVPFAIARALRMHQRKPFDAIYTTSPVKAAPMIGLILKHALRLPWLAEFRDPWYPPERPLRRRLQRALHRLLLRGADKIVVISEGHAAELRAAYNIPAEKIRVISNGYDEDDFLQRRNGSRLLEPGYFHISHFGTIYRNFTGDFFPVLAEMLREKPEWKEKVRFNVIGFSLDPLLAEYAAGELRGVIQDWGYLSHPKAIQAMYESDCLALFLGDPEVSRLSGLGKIYWYLRVGRPVLAIAPEGGTKDLVERGQAGWVAAPGDRAAIRAALEQALSQSRIQEPKPARGDFVAQFRYDRLVRNLAESLNEIRGHGR